EVVDLLLGDLEPMSDEHERCLDGGGWIDAQTEVRVFAERKRDRLAVASQRQTRVALVDLPCLESAGLYVARRAVWVEGGFLELLGDVLGRAFVAGRSGVSSLQRVAREKLDVLPPSVAVGRRTGPAVVRAFSARDDRDGDGKGEQPLDHI